MHAVPGSRSQVHNNISVEEWFDHFKSVLEKDVVAVVDDDVDKESVDDCVNDYSFNRPIAKRRSVVSNP